MPDRSRRVWRILAWPLSVLLILATVAASNVVIRHIPGTEQAARPFVRTGHIGQDVAANSFVANVESVRGARAIEGHFKVVETEGVFVIVKVRITATNSNVRIQTETVRDTRGRVFRATDKTFQSMGEGFYEFQPGVTVEGEIAFEVPKDAAAGLRLEMWKEFATTNDHQTAVSIPLDITDAMVDQWFADARTTQLMEPEVAL
jgi:hypothetical protein